MTNFLSGQLSSKGTVGGKAWRWGKGQGYSDSQLKVAVQQLMNTGVGINNAPGQFFSSGGPMKGVPGMHSPLNPMGKFQGPGGNLGIKYYDQAKKAGHKPSDIYNQATSAGMYLPKQANAQYQKDIQDEFLAEQEMLKKQWMSEFGQQETPGSQTGMANVGSGNNALGVRTPRPAGHELNTGGTTDAFSRKKTKKTKDTASPLAIQSITL